ncbi:hypothetical protein A3F66_04590 [candidate division TM6 bacterium RIFCSPHIGHO2_12_FULL_32_22]|nr:MAG: hypothetical protein A3F66_04590 [candidate division TM6 bacterium RIFCSPHIGHO2_12_FULL_32_22]
MNKLVFIFLFTNLVAYRPQKETLLDIILDENDIPKVDIRNQMFTHDGLFVGIVTTTNKFYLINLHEHKLEIHEMEYLDEFRSLRVIGHDFTLISTMNLIHFDADDYWPETSN